MEADVSPGFPEWLGAFHYGYVAQEVLSDIPIRHNSSLLGCAFFFSVDTLRTLLLLHSVIALGNLNAMKVIESWGDRSQVAIFNYQKQSGHGYFNEQ